jgi:hypothetical protein
MITTALIPTNGVHIVETAYPHGFNVARYDHEGLTSEGHWFKTLAEAEDYAAKLKSTKRRNALLEELARGSTTFERANEINQELDTLDDE